MARGLGSVQENGFRVRGRGVGVRRWARDRDGNIPRRAVVGARWTGPALTKPPWGPTDARSTCRTTPVSSWTCMCRGNGECPSLLPLNHLHAQSTCPRSLRSPRSSASNRIIGAKDHASIQMNVAEVDKVTGRFNGQFKTYAICGAIRRMGESDDSILRLAKADGIVSKNF